MADKLIAVKMKAEGGKVIKAEFADIGREGKRAFQQIESGSRSGSQGLQNVGFQVQDFAVQVAGGTDASRALAQQLPQLLSGFGLLGVGLGTATAVLVPLLSYFMGATDHAKALKDALDDLGKSGDAYRAMLDSALQPMADIRKEFGDQAEEVKKLRAAMLGIEEIQYLRGLKAAKGELTETFAGFDEMMARIDELKAAITDPNAQIGGQIELETMIGRVQREFGVTIEQAYTLRDAVNSWREATGPDEVADASRNLAEVVAEIARGSEGVSDGLLNAGEAAFNLSEQAGSMAMMLGTAGDNADRIATTDMAGGIAAAGAEAFTLAQNLELAARNAAALAAGRIGAGAGRGGDPRQFETDPYWKAQYFPEPYQLQKPKKTGGGRRGGASKGIDKEMREAERLFDSTRTAAEKYDIEVQKIAELHAKFPALITDDVQAKAIENLREKLLDTKDSTEDLKDSFKDMFQSILDGSMSAGEALSNLLASFASNLLSSGLDALWGSLGLGDIFKGFADGGAFDRGRITAFASGGVVDQPTMFGMRGGLGLMGEAGPEAILPLSRGSDGKLGVRSAGGGTAVNVSINVDARGAVEGVADQVARAVQAQTPGIVKQAVAGVAAARQRGYAV